MLRKSGFRVVEYASIKQVAYRDYMYGRDGVIEEWLSKCEGKWSQVVRYLLVEDDTECTEPLEYYLLLVHYGIWVSSSIKDVSYDVKLIYSQAADGFG